VGRKYSKARKMEKKEEETGQCLRNGMVNWRMRS
jgi:hypothetical protein